MSPATLAVKVATHLEQELDIKVDEDMFWTGSRVVLSYIQKTLQNVCGKSDPSNQKQH